MRRQELYQARLFNLIGILIHEACHVYQHEAGINYLTAGRHEVMCHLVELTALNAMNAPSIVINGVQGAIRFHGD